MQTNAGACSFQDVYVVHARAKKRYICIYDSDFDLHHDAEPLQSEVTNDRACLLVATVKLVWMKRRRDRTRCGTNSVVFAFSF